MKCPYQTKVIHKPEYTEGYVTSFAQDITVFCECAKSECPFYYTTWNQEHCSKAESGGQEHQWIPVSERLPKEEGEYLLFGKIDEYEENYIFIGEYDSCGEKFGIWQEQFDRTTLGCLGSEFFEYSSVIAWMHLPKEYKESEG